MNKQEIIDNIKKKLYEMPIFLEEERLMILEKCDFLELEEIIQINEEIENIYTKVEKDRPIIDQKIADMNKDINVFFQNKQSQITKEIISQAEAKDKEENIDNMLNF